MWHTPTQSHSHIHVVTPRALVGVFEATVKSIVKQVLGLAWAYG